MNTTNRSATEWKIAYLPVGDTTGAPDVVRGLRAATIYAEFMRAIVAAYPAG